MLGLNSFNFLSFWSSCLSHRRCSSVFSFKTGSLQGRRWWASRGSQEVHRFLLPSPSLARSSARLKHGDDDWDGGADWGEAIQPVDLRRCCCNCPNLLPLWAHTIWCKTTRGKGWNTQVVYAIKIMSLLLWWMEHTNYQLILNIVSWQTVRRSFRLEVGY